MSLVKQHIRPSLLDIGGCLYSYSDDELDSILHIVHGEQRRRKPCCKEKHDEKTGN